MEISENEGLNSQINTSNVRHANEGKDKVHSKQCDTNRQELKTLECRQQDPKEDDLDLCLLATKTVGEFEERLEWMQRL